MSMYPTPLNPTVKIVPNAWGGNTSQVSAAPQITQGPITPIPSPPISSIIPNVGRNKTYNIPLTNANNQTLIFGGDTLWYKSSTNYTDFITVTFTDSSNDPIILYPGDAIEGFPFTQLIIANTAIVNAVATLVVFNSQSTTKIVSNT